MRSRAGLLVLICSVVLYACVSPPESQDSPPAILPTSTVQRPSPTPTSPPTETQVPTAPPTVQATESSLPTPETPLADTGPWLLFVAKYNGQPSGPVRLGYLWASNLDGSGLTRLIEEPLYTAVPFDGITPDGKRLIACIIPQGAGRVGDPWLRILTFPDLEVLADFPLTSSQTDFTFESMDDGDDIDEFEIERAIVSEGGSLAWSPDGDRLAFIGAMEGTSADVYVYDLSTGQTTRLTDDDSQAHNISWSPDGRFVAYVRVQLFGTGAGRNLSGMGVARSDGSGVITLEDWQTEVESGAERYIGWIGNTRPVALGWRHGPYEDLRIYDIGSGGKTSLVNGRVYTAFYDEVDRVIGLEISEWLGPETDDVLEPGTYLIDVDTGQRTDIFVENTARMRGFSDQFNAFVVEARSKIYLVSSAGEIQEYEGDVNPVFLALGLDADPEFPDGFETIWRVYAIP